MQIQTGRLSEISELQLHLTQTQLATSFEIETDRALRSAAIHLSPDKLQLDVRWQLNSSPLNLQFLVCRFTSDFSAVPTPLPLPYATCDCQLCNEEGHSRFPLPPPGREEHGGVSSNCDNEENPKSDQLLCLCGREGEKAYW